MKKTAVFFFFFLLITSLACGYTLPIPPNTIKEDEQEVNVNNILYTTQLYLSDLSMEEAASFYKENFPQQGFALVGEEEKVHALVFSHPVFKDNLVIAIDNAPENKTLIKISSWHGELAKAKEEAAQPDLTKDAPGSDVPGVPRYPGSVRINAVSFGDMKNASYASQDEKEKILSFYKANMPAQGWKSPGQEGQVKQKIAQMFGANSDIAQSGMLFFQKNNEICSIIVAQACCGKRGSTIGASVFTIPKLKGNQQDED